MTRDKELHDRLVELAKALLDGTSDGTVRWSTTDNENKFIVSGSQSSVTIESFTDRDGDTICTFSLLNNRGSTVDSIVSEWEEDPRVQVSANQVHPLVEQPWNKLLDDLYHVARRSAYNVDEVISSIFSDLENGKLRNPPRAQRAEDPWASGDEPAF